jgi:hypothetical protein
VRAWKEAYGFAELCRVVLDNAHLEARKLHEVKLDEGRHIHHPAEKASKHEWPSNFKAKEASQDLQKILKRERPLGLARTDVAIKKMRKINILTIQSPECKQ